MSRPVIGGIITRLFIFSLGIIMIIPALNQLYTYGNYIFWGDSTYGVIDHPASSRDIGGRPLIRYEDMTGSIHEFKSRAKTHLFFTPQRGEKIKILIAGDDSRKAIVNNLFHYLVLPLIFLVAGGYCCLYVLRGRKGNAEGAKEVPKV